MNESEIKQSVELFIEEHKLDASIVGFEDYDDDYPRIRVEVSREDYERIFILNYPSENYSIQWEQRVPPLVSAEVGDLVLIFGSHDGSDEKSDIGLVSSKFTSEDGSVCYGCRYIKIGLNDQFVNHLYDFELTSEDYGGFPEGFLRVLTPQEAINHLKHQLDVAVVKELGEVNAKFERTYRGLEPLVSSLSQSKTVQCEKIELDEDHIPVSVTTGR